MRQQFELAVKTIIDRALDILAVKGYAFRPMRRVNPVRKNSGYIEGHTSLRHKTITIDIYTARLRKPKKISAILAVLAHEIAHHQKPPYRQYYRGRLITRWHYPAFYKQVNKNIKKFKQDETLSKYFEKSIMV